MILSPADFTFPCSCGRSHTVITRRLAIGPGELHQLAAHCRACGLQGPAAAIYDKNTARAAAPYRPLATQEIVLTADPLHADEAAVDTVFRQLDRPAFLVAVGAGTIHDIVRYCAFRLGIPFVSVPTAASVDGFVSSGAAMSFGGFKVTLPAAPPLLVVADAALLAQAPIRLTRSGLGDLLGKYICLADWEISSLLTGEYYCDGIAGLTRQAVEAAMSSRRGLLTADPDAYQALIYGLLLSGIAMQLCGNSRPASGAEHHVSHLLELGVFGPNEALHGEKVGVAALACAGLYHRLSRMAPAELERSLFSYRAPADYDLQSVFGPLTDAILRENTPDCLAGVGAQVLTERWEPLCRILDTIPPSDVLRDLLHDVGAKEAPEDIQVSASLLPRLLFWAPFSRNRLTLLRIAHRIFPGEAALETVLFPD